MKRYAAHYTLLFPNQILKQHYIELNEKNQITVVAPLTEEIAGTVFYDGIIFPSPIEHLDFNNIIGELGYFPTKIAQYLFELGIIASIETFPVFIYILSGVDFSSPEFGTNNRGRDCDIERL